MMRINVIRSAAGGHATTGTTAAAPSAPAVKREPLADRLGGVAELARKAASSAPGKFVVGEGRKLGTEGLATRTGEAIKLTVGAQLIWTGLEALRSVGESYQNLVANLKGSIFIDNILGRIMGLGIFDTPDGGKTKLTFFAQNSADAWMLLAFTIPSLIKRVIDRYSSNNGTKAGRMQAAILEAMSPEEKDAYYKASVDCTAEETEFRTQKKKELDGVQVGRGAKILSGLKAAADSIPATLVTVYGAALLFKTDISNLLAVAFKNGTDAAQSGAHALQDTAASSIGVVLLAAYLIYKGIGKIVSK